MPMTKTIASEYSDRNTSDTRPIQHIGSGSANGMQQIPSIANGNARNSESAAQPGADR
jgi:hypothetical protein